MKTLILAALFITFGLTGCIVTEPHDGYYSQQRVYNNGYSYDRYYDPFYDNSYTIRRVYDYNTGRYYDVPVYGGPVYGVPVYSGQTYRRDNYRRENTRVYNQPRSRNEQQQASAQPQEKRLPDGTRISPDGTITLPNGQVRTRQ